MKLRDPRTFDDDGSVFRGVLNAVLIEAFVAALIVAVVWIW